MIIEKILSILLCMVTFITGSVYVFAVDDLYIADNDIKSRISDDELLMQSIDQIICETCMFRDHCYGGMCIANKEWRDNMRRSMFEMAKGKKAL